ncbi:hypothetical protein BDV41DRAFT_574882 [Aspergillus transmontanensis]|uniref:Uncharacterized protein n=1 Tax=Aspergillus transmontanensis TaxID=1034304 RepID=A0A5N6W3T7_9EURO|nr:hypothetical protein BDV41DRAFT_574882 [Aspergillus transmontanensis]
MSVELIQTPPQVQEAIESNETVVIHYTGGEPSPFKFIIYDLAGVRPNVQCYIVDSDYIL